MKKRVNRAIALFFLAYAALMTVGLFFCMGVHAADRCDQYAGLLTREAQAVNGLNAPVPAYMAQMRQESECRADVTAADLGRGIEQYMDGTAKQVASMFPELGPPQPYDPRWAIRATVRFDTWLARRVQGKDECHRLGAALKSYNAGLGYVLQAQKASTEPKTWFGITEFVPTRQSTKNFEYSRLYPRWILLKHQLRYVALGHTVCLPSPT